jgi:hypothetical protein
MSCPGGNTSGNVEEWEVRGVCLLTKIGWLRRSVRPNFPETRHQNTFATG